VTVPRTGPWSPRRLRRKLARAALRAAGVLDGRALALREDLGALVMAVERHQRGQDGVGAASLDFALGEARRSLSGYDHTRGGRRWQARR
jgi:hypothetical protein